MILRTTPLPVRIDDSKRLTAAARARAWAVILEQADVGFGIACAAEIDRSNIQAATLLAMQRAVEDLSVPPDVVLVDWPVAPSLAFPCWPFIRGDQRSYAIACASIAAKVLRDRLMAFYHTLEPRYGFHRHKGYGTALHTVRLRRFGPSLFHRRTFRPVAEAILDRLRSSSSHDTARFSQPATASAGHVDAVAVTGVPPDPAPAAV